MLRAIETIPCPEATPPADFGAALDLRWLPIAALRVDGRYQRQITRAGRAAVRRIVANFSWRYFTPAIVSPIEGGLYAVIDGQHRATAAAICGIAEVPCAVTVASSREQAAAFKVINGTATRLFPYQIFRAALAAGDAEAEKLDALVRRAGVMIQTPGDSKRPDGTLCVAVLERSAALHGEEVTIAALRCLRETAKEGETWLRATPIGAVAAVLASRPHWLKQEGRLFNAFALFDFAEILERAVTAAMRQPGTGTPNQLQAGLLARLAKAMGDEAAPPLAPAPIGKTGAIIKPPPRTAAGASLVDRRPVGDQTSRLMGDPAPGRSALDMERAAR